MNSPEQSYKEVHPEQVEEISCLSRQLGISKLPYIVDYNHAKRIINEYKTELKYRNTNGIEIFGRARRILGTTRYPEHGTYILPGGEILRWPKKLHHIEDFGALVWPKGEESPSSKGVDRLMLGWGAIRINTEFDEPVKVIEFHLMKTPTTHQIETIERIHKYSPNLSGYIVEYDKVLEKTPVKTSITPYIHMLDTYLPSIGERF